MKTPFVITVSAVAMAIFVTTSGSAGILAGPITNSANGHIYYLLTTNSWSASEAEAVSLGGHLVTINDSAEDNFVYTNFSSFGGRGRYLWIGLNDLPVKGTYEWVSGEASTYRNWAPGEPSGYNPTSRRSEDCGSIFAPNHGSPGRWNDAGDTDGGYTGVVEVVPNVRPSSPEKPQTSEVTGRSEFLHWPASTDASRQPTRYEVQYWNAFDMSQYWVHYDVPECSVLLVDLDPATYYTAVVKAVFQDGTWSAWSPTTTFQTRSEQITTPGRPRATTLTTSSQLISWSAATHLAGRPIHYELQLWNATNPSDMGQYQVMQNLNVNWTTVSGLHPNTQYTVTAKALALIRIDPLMLIKTDPPGPGKGCSKSAGSLWCLDV